MKELAISILILAGVVLAVGIAVNAADNERAVKCAASLAGVTASDSIRIYRVAPECLRAKP